MTPKLPEEEQCIAIKVRGVWQGPKLFGKRTYCEEPAEPDSEYCVQHQYLEDR